MAPIDSILNLVDRQGANELRLGSDREPQMFADGAQKKLVIPKTTTETLRELLGDLLSPERERELVEHGSLHFLYEAHALGPFRVALTRRGPAQSPKLELDVVFLRGRGKGPVPPPAAAKPAAPAVHAPVAAPPPAPLAAVPVAHQPVAPATPPALVAPAPTTPGGALEDLLRRAAALRASDVHLLDGAPPRLRIDGRLRLLSGEPACDVQGLLGPLLTPQVRERLAGLVSADFGVGVPGVGRYRVNVFQTQAGLAAAIRLLADAPPALADLRFPVPLDDLVDLPHGLVLVTGPTGSGKSTTLAALAREAIVRHPRLLVTLEDPIEFSLGTPGAQGLALQRQVGREVKDFATGLRDALREDPDLLLIGEMRDPETISLALTAAETGHLVLASLHTRSAASAVERIVDTYAPERHQQVRVQLADALRAVVSQRLLPRVASEGRGARRPEGYRLAPVEEAEAPAGRVLAAEIMRGNHAVAGAIREGKTGAVQSAIQSGRREGMIALERCLADLVQKRQISLEVARGAANDPSALTSYLAG